MTDFLAAAVQLTSSQNPELNFKFEYPGNKSRGQNQALLIYAIIPTRRPALAGKFYNDHRGWEIFEPVIRQVFGCSEAEWRTLLNR